MRDTTDTDTTAIWDETYVIGDNTETTGTSSGNYCCTTAGPFWSEPDDEEYAEPMCHPPNWREVWPTPFEPSAQADRVHRRTTRNRASGIGTKNFSPARFG